jgi:single-strand DNA-binding protein
MNKVILAGTLGNDPEVETVGSNNTPKTRLSIAVQEYTKGEYVTVWHSVTVLGKTAEYCGNHLSKGCAVAVEGKVQQDNWEKDGQKHYRTSLLAHNVQRLAKAKGDSGSTPTNIDDDEASLLD